MAREFVGEVTDGRIVLPESERARLKDYAKGLTGRIVISVRPFRSQRSLKQNSRMWALLTVAAQELGEHSAEDLHESVAMHLLKLPDDEKTGLPRRKRTPKLNTAEFASYTDQIEMFFRSELHLSLDGWEHEAEKLG